MLSSSMAHGTRSTTTVATRMAAMMAPRLVTFQRRLSVSAASYADQAQPPVARSYADFCIYKGKAAVTFKPIAPTFKDGVAQSGQNPGGQYFSVEKEGVLLVAFASVKQDGPQSGYGSRAYDWGNKITFALNPLELAQLTDFDITGPVANKDSIEFFHDPNKGNPNAAQAPKTSKSLRLSMQQQGGHAAGYMLSLTVTTGGNKANVAVPIARHEYVALKHLAAFSIPRLYGWDYVFQP